MLPEVPFKHRAVFPDRRHAAVTPPSLVPPLPPPADSHRQLEHKPGHPAGSIMGPRLQASGEMLQAYRQRHRITVATAARLLLLHTMLPATAVAMLCSMLGRSHSSRDSRFIARRIT